MNISDRLPIFRSPEQERMLAELFVYADEPLSLSELARRASTSVAGAHKEAERLEAAGLIKSTMVGRNRLVQADQSSPVHGELRGLLLKTFGPEPLLRAALADISGIDEAFIYGSWADPAETSPGDVDVMVIGEPDVLEVYNVLSAVEDQIGRPVDVSIRSAAEWSRADGGFERTVRSRPRIDLR